jgi:predicted RNase H-like HicB family nuclease
VNRDPSYYLKLPYRQLWEWREDDAEPYWVVRLAEIPEIVGDGATRAEAEAALRQCLAD